MRSKAMALGIALLILGSGSALAQDDEADMPPNARARLEGKVAVKFAGVREPVPVPVRPDFTALVGEGDLADELARREPRRLDFEEVEARKQKMLDASAHRAGRSLARTERPDLAEAIQRGMSDTKLVEHEAEDPTGAVLGWFGALGALGFGAVLYWRHRF